MSGPWPVRLRESHPDLSAFYRGRYPGGYSHGDWPDHVERIKASAEFLADVAQPADRIADLSCGDAALADALVQRGWGLGDILLGDLVPNYAGLSCRSWNSLGAGEDGPPGRVSFVQGELPESLGILSETDPVDLYLCSETLEHVEHPSHLLRLLRPKAKAIFISTPDEEQPAPDGGGNPEHYWGWDRAAIRDMLLNNGWMPRSFSLFTPKSADVYRFQFWYAT